MQQQAGKRCDAESVSPSQPSEQDAIIRPGPLSLTETNAIILPLRAVSSSY